MAAFKVHLCSSMWLGWRWWWSGRKMMVMRSGHKECLRNHLLPFLCSGWWGYKQEVRLSRWHMTISGAAQLIYFTGRLHKEWTKSVNLCSLRRLSFEEHFNSEQCNFIPLLFVAFNCTRIPWSLQWSSCYGSIARNKRSDRRRVEIKRVFNGEGKKCYINCCALAKEL